MLKQDIIKKIRTNTRLKLEIALMLERSIPTLERMLNKNHVMLTRLDVLKKLAAEMNIENFEDLLEKSEAYFSKSA